MKETLAERKAMAREERRSVGRGGTYRFFVQFSVKPYFRGERHIWGRLFDTRAEAMDAMNASASLFTQSIPDRRIVSAAVQSVRVA